MDGAADSPYKLSWGTDVTLSSSILLLRYLTPMIPSNVQTYTAQELDSKFSAGDVNPLERPFIGPLNDIANTISNTTNGIIWCLPFSFLALEKSRKDFLKLGLMFIQIQLMYPIVTQTINPLVARKRPFFYAEEEDMAERQSAWAQISFVSGHANFGCAFAVFFANCYSDYYPKSKWKPYVWIASLGLATGTAIFRVAAHQHFPSDVVAGAATGSLLGWFVPFIHKKKKDRVALAPLVTRGGGTGIAISASVLY